MPDAQSAFFRGSRFSHFPRLFHQARRRLHDTLPALAKHFLLGCSVRRASGRRRARQCLRAGNDAKERCHAIDKKVVGPAYQDVAAKYKGDKDALAKLSDKVKKGGVGVWGEVPMPPNVQVSDADIKDLVGWILTLKK